MYRRNVVRQKSASSFYALQQHGHNMSFQDRKGLTSSSLTHKVISTGRNRWNVQSLGCGPPGGAQSIGGPTKHAIAELNVQ